MEDPVKKMSVQEFREFGYLQELNRRFLHPLGLALSVVVDIVDGETVECFGPVWDCRDDPEGLVFVPNTIDRDKALRIYHEGAEKGILRQAKMGFVSQPLPEA